MIFPFYTNFVNILLAMVTVTALGFVWYMPQVFGNTWMKLAGIDLKKMKSPLKPMLLSLAVNLVMIIGLGQAISALQIGGPLGGLMTGLWLGVLFVAPSTIMHDAYEQRPLALTAINLGYTLAAMALSGAVLAVGL